MYRTLSCVAVGLALALGVGLAAGQPQDKKDDPPQDKKDGPPKDRKGGPGMKALRDLDLTEEQKPKVERIQKAHEEKMQALFMKFMEGRKKLDAATLKDLKEVLTEKQYDTVAEAMKKAPPGFEKKKGPPSDDGKKDKKGPPDDKKGEASQDLVPRPRAAAARPEHYQSAALGASVNSRIGV